MRRFDGPLDATLNDLAWFLVKVFVAFALLGAFAIGWMSL